MTEMTDIDPKSLIASVRRDLETVGRYYLKKGEQDLAKQAFHLSGMALALEVCARHEEAKTEPVMQTTVKELPAGLLCRTPDVPCDCPPGYCNNATMALRTCPKCSASAVAFICSEPGCPVNGGAFYG